MSNEGEPKPNGHSTPGGEKKKRNTVKNLYLVVYNSALVVCWCLVLLKGAVHLSEKKSLFGLYGEVEYWLKVAQTVAICEVFHALFGLVRSSPLVTLMQITSRLLVLWLYLDVVLMRHEGTRDTLGFPVLLFAWTITEIIRYTFYTYSLLDIISTSLVWCRYSFFIVLYPLGVAGELMCIAASLPIVRQLASPGNVTTEEEKYFYNFVHYASYVGMLSYIPGFYHLYTYMLGQRRKVLQTNKDKNA